MKKLILSALAVLFAAGVFAQDGAQSASPQTPLRLGIAGLSHDHIWEVVNSVESGAFEIVGIFEADTAVLAQSRLAQMFPDKVYRNLGDMVDAAAPEAVMAYGSVFDHLSVVEACAPKGVHVMVEKPLAVSPAHAKKMAALAKQYGTLVLTNYETTWYPTNHMAHKMVADGQVGRLVRINVFDGHEGPVEINCNPQFLAWLTDPVLNGGGAVVDFGCYGANLATWFMGGARPLNVYAVLKQNKPQTYPRVDDDATIVLEYPACTVEIMASWDWPQGRKDMHIYGEKGYIYQDTKTELRFGGKWGDPEYEEILSLMPAPYDTPFNYLRAAVRGQITVKPADLSALENNLTVVDILDAAKQSSRTKKAVKIKQAQLLQPVK